MIGVVSLNYVEPKMSRIEYFEWFGKLLSSRASV